MIHAHVATVVGKYAVFLGKLFKIPVVITEHTPTELINYDRKILKLIAHYAYKNSSYNACVSKFSKKELDFLFPDCNFEVVYNGIHKPNVEKNDKVYRIEKCINISIVASFYNEWVKGYQYLIPAIKEIRNKGYNIILHIVGGGEYQDKYEQLAKKNKIEKFCIFYGNCNKDKVYSIMNQMDFCVSTSLVESAGVSVQEALMLGKPVVVTNSGGANSLVTEKNSIVIEKGSTEAIVDGIIEMIKKYKCYNKDEIIKYAQNNFEISNISNKYMNIYKSLYFNKS